MSGPKQNIVLELCELVGTKGQTELGRLFGVNRQVVNGWKDRNKIPEGYIAKAVELTGKPHSYFLAGPKRKKSATAQIAIQEFLADPTRYLEQARNGQAVTLTVRGEPVVSISRVQSA